MPIDAVNIVAIQPVLTRSLTRDSSEAMNFLLRELEVVAMQALLWLARLVVPAALGANVVVVAYFQLLQFVKLTAVVLHRLIDALSFDVAQNFPWLVLLGGGCALLVGEGQCS